MMHERIAHVCTTVGRRIIIVRTRFGDETLIAFAVCYIAEEFVVDIVVITELVAHDKVEAALIVCPRVIAVFIEIANGFIHKIEIGIEQFKGAHRFQTPACRIQQVIDLFTGQ